MAVLEMQGKRIKNFDILILMKNIHYEDMI